MNFDEPSRAQMVRELKDRGYWFTNSLIPQTVITTVLKCAEKQFSNDQFRPAKIGRGEGKKIEDLVRRDKIFWIEDWATEPFLQLSQTFDGLMDSFRKDLFLPVKSFEGHLARYEPGAFYARHVDRHLGSSSRVLSLVLYLNTLKKNEGGELVLFEGDNPVLELPPEAGKLIVFDSQMPHEVRLTLSPRWSLTIWFLTGF